MSENPSAPYRFDRFIADPRTARLLSGGEAVAIEPKVFLVLVFLLENRHRLVEKQELLDAVWHDTVVTENAVTRAVARLRGILGDDAREPRFVETVHSRGYRFVGEVECIQPAGSGTGGVVVPEASASIPSAPRSSSPAGRRSRWPLAIAAAGLALLGAIAWQRIGGGASRVTTTTSAEPPAAERAATTGEALDPRRIAALPMVDLSGGDDAYFVDGLTEQMISTLSRIDGLRVVPRTTVMAYKGTDRRIAEIGRELGAGTVLEGSVRRSGEQLRITVQLVDVAREQTLWSAELDRPLRDVFRVQSEVAVRVAEALQSSVAPAALERIERGPTRVMGAWDLYLRGRQFHRQQTRAGMISAVEQYRRALELDPDFGLALAQIANAYAHQALVFETPDGWPDVAVSAAERALELDPDLPQAYRALGSIALYQDRFQRAFDFAMKAVELDPNSFASVYNAASFAQNLGRLDEAVLLLLRSGSSRLGHRAILAMDLMDLGFTPQAEELARRVLEEEPLTIYLNLYLARRDMIAGELTAAMDRLERLSQAYPLWEGIYLAMGRIETRAGRPAAALALFDKTVATADHGNPEAEIRGARIRWRRGERAAAGEILERLAVAARRAVDGGSDSWILRWQLAAIEAVRGNPDQAVGWLAQAVDLGRYHHNYDQDDPLFESLRGDPRFEQQLERMRGKVATMREHLVRELGPDLGGIRPAAISRD